MVSTFTTNIRLDKQGVGSNSGTWGSVVNTQLDLLDAAVAGITSVTFSGSNVTLTQSSGLPDQSRSAILVVRGNVASNLNLFVPAGQSKTYFVRNKATGAGQIVVTPTGGTGVSVASGENVVVHSDGFRAFEHSNRDRLNAVDTRVGALESGNFGSRVGTLETKVSALEVGDFVSANIRTAGFVAAGPRNGAPLHPIDVSNGLIRCGGIQRSDNAGLIVNLTANSSIMFYANAIEFRDAAGPTLRGQIGSGLFMGAPAGLDRGHGTINAQSVFDDNVLLTCYAFEAANTSTVDVDKWDGFVEYGIHKAARDFDQRRLKVADYGDFWKANGHFPNMPSPSEWKEKGSLSVGSMVQKLWEIVEVQAVHIDKLHKRICVLEANSCDKQIPLE